MSYRLKLYVYIHVYMYTCTYTKKQQLGQLGCQLPLCCTIKIVNCFLILNLLCYYYLLICLLPFHCLTTTNFIYNLSCLEEGGSTTSSLNSFKPFQNSTLTCPSRNPWKCSSVNSLIYPLLNPFLQ